MGFQFQQPFDARQVEPSSFAPPPVYGDYHVQIVDAEAKPTTDQTGGYLQLDLLILDPGPYLNSKIPYRLNLFNKMQQTVEIAYRQLSAVCHVVGVFNVQDARQLMNIPFIATIGPQKDNPQYANVFAVKDLHGNIPGKAATQAVPQAVPQAAAPAPAPVAPAPAPWAPPGQAVQPPAPAAPAWAPPATPAVTPAWAPSGAPSPAAPAPPVWGAQPQAAAPAAAAWQPAGPPAAPPWAK